MNLFEQVQNMSAEEQQQLLDTDFGPELEKQAAEELGKAELADALYTYGAYLAEVELEAQGELSKEASEEYNQVGSEISQAVESGLEASGILDLDDTVALHKEAQAAAAIMFQGYADQIEDLVKEAKKKIVKKPAKVAAKPAPGMGAKLHGMVKNVGKKLHEAASASGKYVAKHKAPLGIGAGVGLGAAGLGALAYKKHHEKKAYELTVEEIYSAVAEEAEFNAVVCEGLEKLANNGKQKAAKAVAGGMMHHLGKAKDAIKGHAAAAGKWVSNKASEGKKIVTQQHPGKAGLAAGALAGGALTHAAHKMSEKE